MAARAGEENVATLFGDVHYFYGPEDTRPRHHRFEKGSYVYLFENAYDRRCRIEIANQPGTDEQDAFDGFLDQSRVRYSYKQHCTVSLTVADSVDHSEWHLPTYDMRNEKKYHYKLHSLDIYFWTQKDALQFINGVRRVLPSVQVEILDEPGLPQSTEISSVVQRLENVAVSDPLYGAAASPPSTTASQEPTVGVPLAASPDTPVNAALPPPPPPPPAKFVPMVYNPAAPAAPELIRHREKTPPPDEDPLNPLAVAVAHDYQKQPFTPGLPPQSQLPPGVTSPGLPLYTSNISSFQSQFAGPPKHPAVQRAATMPANASLVSPGFPVSPGLIPTPPSQPSATVPGQPGGFSDHTHHHQGSVQKDGQDYSIHQQLYRPTEGEYGKKNRPHQYQPKQETRGRLEENAGRLERGVSGMLKKFEKKFG